MKISIIIPSYNRASLLEEAIISILSHVDCDCEILVCDDASTDRTGELCESIAVRGAMITHLRSERRLGAQEARNRGMRHANGDVVMFMDSDDTLAGHGIMEVLAALDRDPDLEYAYGRVVKTDALLQPLMPAQSVGKRFNNIPFEYAGYHWHTMGAVYRKGFLEKVGPWNEALTGSQDWEYQARVKLAGGKGLFVDTMVGYWRHHDGARVGTNRFRTDYVTSVMVACQSILAKAKEVGLSDPRLEMRLAKKLVIHALEWGANGFKDEKVCCLQQAQETATGSRLMKYLCGAIKLMPGDFDRIALRALRQYSH